MVSWEVRKRDGIFGLFIRDYAAQGCPVDWTLFKKLTFEEGYYLLEHNLARGDREDIERWEKEAGTSKKKPGK